MKTQNFYTTFTSFRQQLRDSIEALNTYIVGLTDVSDDASTALAESTITLSDGVHSIGVSKQNNILSFLISKYIDRDTTEETTYNVDLTQVDNFMEETLPEVGMTIYQTIIDANESQKLDAELDNINTQMLNYGQVDSAYIRDRMNKLSSLGLGVVDYLEASIGSLPSTCDAYCWSTAIMNLDKPLYDQYEQDGSFNLQIKYVSIKQFVGGAILDLVANIAQILLIASQAILKVLSFVINLVINIIKYATNIVTPSNFTINYKGLDGSLDTPCFAASGPTIGSNYDLSTSVPTDAVLRNFTPAMYKEYWRYGDTTFCNAFLTLNILHTEFANYLWRQLHPEYSISGSPDYFGYLRFKTADFIALREDLINNGLPDYCYVNKESYYTQMPNNRIAGSIAASILYTIITSPWAIQNEGEYMSFKLDSLHGLWGISGNIENSFGFMMAKLLSNSIFYAYGFNFPTWDSLITGLGDFHNALLNQQWGVTTLYLPTKAFNSDTDWYFTNNVFNLRPYSIGISGSLADAEEVLVSAPLQDHTFSWPAYSSDALKNTLLIAGTVAAVGVAAYEVAKISIGRLKTNYQLKQVQKLTQLSDSYKQDPTRENLAALTSAARKYNFKAKIFGLQTYDVANNWMNDYDSPTESNDNSSKILKLIKG